MKFHGRGQPLTRAGLSKALAILGLGPDDAGHIWTVIEIETAGITQGFGFRIDRRPQILFERHMFRKYTHGRFDSEAPDVSGPAGGYGLLSEQYVKLEKSLALCAKAKLGAEPALKSASWGVGQVMGFNCGVGGFRSCARMVQAMVRSEDAQLGCMAGFLKANGLAEKLLNRDWTGLRSGKNRRYQRFAHARAIKNFRIAAGLPASEELDGPTYQALCKKAGIRP